MSNVQPMGQLTQELEDVVSKMIDQHALQNGEVMNILHGYLQVHYPKNHEPYVDGTHPFYFYGHADGLINYGNKLDNLMNLRKNAKKK